MLLISELIWEYCFQQPKSILAQVQLHPRVPIHTISFNCSDREANQFLCDLARESGGRFHYYSEHGIQIDGPEPWEVCIGNIVTRIYILLSSTVPNYIKHMSW